MIPVITIMANKIEMLYMSTGICILPRKQSMDDV